MNPGVYHVESWIIFSRILQSSIYFCCFLYAWKRKNRSVSKGGKRWINKVAMKLKSHTFFSSSKPRASTKTIRKKQSFLCFVIKNFPPVKKKLLLLRTGNESEKLFTFVFFLFHILSMIFLSPSSSSCYGVLFWLIFVSLMRCYVVILSLVFRVLFSLSYQTFLLPMTSFICV